MEKKTVFVAITNQKGGVGKSAVTVLMASYFHYAKRKNVLVVDCDFPQHSISAMCKRDRESVMLSETYQNLLRAQYSKTGQGAYRVLNASPGNARRIADEYIENSDPNIDLVLLDLPGTVNTPGMLSTLFSMDYIIIPIVADRMIMQSSLVFAETIHNYRTAHPDCGVTDVLLLWNRVDNRVSKELYNYYDEVIERLGISVFNTKLPETQRYSRELSTDGNRASFRSTLLSPSSKLLSGSNVNVLADEMIERLKL